MIMETLNNSWGYCHWICERAFMLYSTPLLAKLKAYGLDRDSCALLRDYPSNQQQRVKIGDTILLWKTVKNEVPQGSLLDPNLTIFSII